MPPIRDGGAGEVALDELRARARPPRRSARRSTTGSSRCPSSTSSSAGPSRCPSSRGTAPASAVISGGQPAELDELAERLEHQIRIHRGGAVADEHGDAVHAARLAGLDDDARLQARAFADEMVVHGPGRKQGGNRHTTGAGTSVGEDEDVRAGGERDIRLCTNSFDRGLETVGAVGGRPTSCRSSTT